MNLRLKLSPGIYLAGFAASGKTTIGRLLANRMGWSFADLDAELKADPERKEAEYRRAETEALQRLVRVIQRGKPTIVALSSDAFAQPANRDLALQHGIAIWLDCPLETVRHRLLKGPHALLAGDPEKLTALYRERCETYALADLRIAMEGDDPLAVVEIIATHPILR
jgi:shikimate kinase